jgi:hypothetical protein
MHVIDVGGGVAVRDLTQLSAIHLSQFLLAAVLCHCLEECVEHRVGVSLSALYPETTVVEPSVGQHLPDDGMSPIVRSHLGVDGYTIIVMSCFQHLGYCQHLVQGDANEVLSEFFEGDFEGSFVILTLTHGVTYYTVSVSNK